MMPAWRLNSSKVPKCAFQTDSVMGLLLFRERDCLEDLDARFRGAWGRILVQNGFRERRLAGVRGFLGDRCLLGCD
jgi:hypothetical protein